MATAQGGVGPIADKAEADGGRLHRQDVTRICPPEAAGVGGRTVVSLRGTDPDRPFDGARNRPAVLTASVRPSDADTIAQWPAGDPRYALVRRRSSDFDW